MKQKKEFSRGEYLFPDTQSSDIHLEHTYRGSWIESSPFAGEASSLPDEFLGPSLRIEKIRLFFILCIIVLVLLFARTVQLQLIQGSGFLALSKKNTVKTIITPAHRGIFFDRNGTELVHNTPNFIVHIIPHDFLSSQDSKNQSVVLARILGERLEDIDTKIQSAPPYQPLLLKEHLDYDTALSLITLFHDIPGVSVIAAEGREYVFDDGMSFSHILGMLGHINEKEYEKEKDVYQISDSVGKEGLERFYEAALRGKSGKKQVEVDALGSEKGIVAHEVPQDGKNLILTIDKNLQIQSEKILGSILKRFHKTKGVVIISKAQSGELLSVVSLPSYDSNEFARGITKDRYAQITADPDKPLYNRAFFGEYPSGSTIKPLIAAAALEEGIVTEKSVISSVGGIRIGQWFFPDWKGGGHGATTVTKALAESVNTFFYYVGGGYEKFEGLGEERLIRYFKAFGLGSPLGVDFLGEKGGFVPSPEWKRTVKKEPWYIGDTYHISIGQGDLLVTPLQVNSMTSYFANGGKNYVFHLLKEQMLADKTSKELFKEKIFKEHIVSDKNVSLVRKGMRQTVVAGSARRLATLSVPVAAKTGTAQWGKGRIPHAWFTGWAPYENPQIVFTILIEEGEEGSKTAILVAEDLLKWYFDPLRVKKLLTKTK